VADDEALMETNRRKVIDGLAAGFVSTLVMTAGLLAAPALGGGRLPAEAARAVLGLRAHPAAALLALVVHLAYGSLAGGLFTAGARAITVGRGALFGLGMWGVAVAVYAPVTGLGFVASREPALSVFALPIHLLYGVALGALAPRGEIVQPLETETC
jgi:hypothetical protein